MTKPFQYGSDKLTPAIVIALAEGTVKGIIPEDSMPRILKSCDHVEKIVSSKKTVYGINTGFGILSNTHISPEDTQTLQHKILQSHSVGVGDRSVLSCPRS